MFEIGSLCSFVGVRRGGRMEGIVISVMDLCHVITVYSADNIHINQLQLTLTREGFHLEKEIS